MQILKTILTVVLTLVMNAAAAQGWPQKPVRFVVPFAPGGATDIAARMLGEKLTQVWGQSVIVENRSGAGGGRARDARWLHAVLPVGVGDDGEPARVRQDDLRPGARLRSGDQRRLRPA